MVVPHRLLFYKSRREDKNIIAVYSKQHSDNARTVSYKRARKVTTEASSLPFIYHLFFFFFLGKS